MMTAVAENLCAVLHAPRDLRIENQPLPPPRSGEVTVRVIVTGICGSDLSTFLKGGIGGEMLQKPCALGHEAAGVVHALPEGVAATAAGLRVGDRVAIKPGISCLSCKQCLKGFQNRCIHERYLAHPPEPGAMCQYFLSREDLLIKLPDNVSWRAAGCLQPLAIGVQIARRAQLRAHATVCVIGCGPIGQIAMSMARAYSARRVVAVDIDAARAEFAQKTRRADRAWTSQRAPEAWAALTDPLDKLAAARADAALWKEGTDGFDIVIEATGSEAGAMQAVELCAMGGTYCQVGLGPAVIHLNQLTVAMKELTVSGLRRYNVGCFEDALDLLARKQVDVDEIVTNHWTLHDAAAAFYAVRDCVGIKHLVWSFQVPPETPAAPRRKRALW